MSDTTHQHRQRLTDEQLAHICERARADGDTGWVTAIIETFRALGVDLATCEHDVKPWEYAIPTDQWGTIATACDSGGPLARVNHMLDWMNKGPSSYEEGQ